MIKSVVFFVVSFSISAAAIAGSNNPADEPGLALTEEFREQIYKVRLRGSSFFEDRESREFWRLELERILGAEDLKHRFEKLKISSNYKRAVTKARECFRLKRSSSYSDNDNNYDFYDTSNLCKNIRAKNNEYLQLRVAELQSSAEADQ